MINRRKFIKIVNYIIFSLLGYISLKNISLFLPPPPKKILISKNELQRLKNVLFTNKLILTKKQGRIQVFLRKCPHLGCKLGYDPENQIIVCPCHKSKFTLNGKYIEGPAKRDLFKLNFKIVKQGLEVEIPS